MTRPDPTATCCKERKESSDGERGGRIEAEPSSLAHNQAPFPSPRLQPGRAYSTNEEGEVILPL